MLPEYELDRNISLFLKWRNKLSWNLVFKQHLRRWEAHILRETFILLFDVAANARTVNARAWSKCTCYKRTCSTRARAGRAEVLLF